MICFRSNWHDQAQETGWIGRCNVYVGGGGDDETHTVEMCSGSGVQDLQGHSHLLSPTLALLGAFRTSTPGPRCLPLLGTCLILLDLTSMMLRSLLTSHPMSHTA